MCLKCLPPPRSTYGHVASSVKILNSILKYGRPYLSLAKSTLIVWLVAISDFLKLFGFLKHSSYTELILNCMSEYILALTQNPCFEIWRFFIIADSLLSLPAGWAAWDSDDLDQRLRTSIEKCPQ